MTLLEEHKDALLRYINAFPNRWKSEVRKQWDNPMCIASLRAIRNSYGPSWLDKVTAQQIRDAKTR